MWSIILHEVVLAFFPKIYYNRRMKNTLNDELAVCGFAAVKTLEKKNWQRIQRLYFTEERAPLFGGLCKKLSAEKKPYNIVESSELEKLCGSVHHQGVVAMIKTPEILPLNTDITARWIEEKEDAILLDRVGNANNLGAIVRSAAFFGVKNIVIPLDEAQSSVTTSSYRVAEGGMEFVNIYSIKSIPKLLAAMEGQMLRLGTALDATETTRDMCRMDKDLPILAVLGNEENGISKAVRENVDHLVLIPFCASDSESAVDSLNVAQASAVLMYEMSGRKATKKSWDDNSSEPRNFESKRYGGSNSGRSTAGRKNMDGFEEKDSYRPNSERRYGEKNRGGRNDRSYESRGRVSRRSDGKSSYAKKAWGRDDD